MNKQRTLAAVRVSLQWFEEKLQEVESTDQYFRKLHALVESLVVHRKGLCPQLFYQMESPLGTFTET